MKAGKVETNIIDIGYLNDENIIYWTRELLTIVIVRYLDPNFYVAGKRRDGLTP